MSEGRPNQITAPGSQGEGLLPAKKAAIAVPDVEIVSMLEPIKGHFKDTVERITELHAEQKRLHSQLSRLILDAFHEIEKISDPDEYKKALAELYADFEGNTGWGSPTFGVGLQGHEVYILIKDEVERRANSERGFESFAKLDKVNILASSKHIESRHSSPDEYREVTQQSIFPEHTADGIYFDFEGGRYKVAGFRPGIDWTAVVIEASPERTDFISKIRETGQPLDLYTDLSFFRTFASEHELREFFDYDSAEFNHKDSYSSNHSEHLSNSYGTSGPIPQRYIDKIQKEIREQKEHDAKQDKGSSGLPPPYSPPALGV
jgi:hypothetical protein